MDLFDQFLLRSLLAGILMVVVAAPMGCLMVWQRLAFLADTLAHASVLGVAIGLLLAWQPIFGVLLVILLIMLIVWQTYGQPLAMSESVLAIIAHSGLAGGILLLGLGGFRNISLEAILFGDLLAVSGFDLMMMAVTVAVLLSLLWRHWHALVAISISPEIAQAEGIPVQRLRVILYLMIALLIAVMLKIVGVLLVGAMLVIPVNAARLFSRGPEQMMWLSQLFGMLALLSGMGISWQYDLQTGPAIVVMATVWLLVSLGLQRVLRAKVVSMNS